MKKYQNKYRLQSARLQSWHYGSPALYFVTICTQNRAHHFGQITNGEMQLSEIGEIVKIEWLRTFEIRPDMNLYMGEYMVMPNHFHAVLGIGINQYNDGCDGRDAMHRVSTTTDGKNKNQFGPQSKNLSSVIRGFKSSVTITVRTINPEFQWQARFHDHIIRSYDSFQKISNYIVNNPTKWREDRFFRNRQDNK